MNQSKPGAGNMPIGLMMSLAQNPEAMHNFSLLSDEEQKSVIQFVENSSTGKEAKSRIERAVQNLEAGNHSFLG